MGPVPLAIYSTAAYQVPLVNIVQTSLSDVIFPDLVKRAQRDPAEGLRLWKRAQMMVAAVILPAWLLLSYFAEPLIRLAFTDAYVAATPYFQVFLLLMVRQCFQFSTLLRSVEDNASFATSSAIALGDQRRAHRCAHAAIRTVGTDAGTGGRARFGPPSISARRVMLRYRVPAAEIFHWRKLALSFAASLLALATMHGALAWLPRTHVSLAAGAGGCSAPVYALAARFILREEYGYVVRAFTRRRPAPHDQARTVIIISYWFAPSPAVGAKRFSFLAREFARLGYDVHVITHESREWTDWKIRRVAAARRPGASLRGDAETAARRQGPAAAGDQRRAAAGCWRPWAGSTSGRRAATRKALEVARKLPPGVVIATSPARARRCWPATESRAGSAGR